MENIPDLEIEELVKNICRCLVDFEDRLKITLSIVKVNNENLSKYGELCFLTNLETWKKILGNNFESMSRCRNILEYYLKKNKIEYEEQLDAKSAEKAFQDLIRASNNFSLKIEKCILRNERVCIFLNRTQTFTKVVPRIVAKNSSYGIFESKKNRSFYFNIIQDQDSDLTNLRLSLIEDVAKNIIKAHGYQISENEDSEKYDLTTKSRNDSKNPSKVLLCGVVKNSMTGTKETKLTEVEYMNEKLKELSDTINNKFPLSEDWERQQSSILKQIAKASVAWEFLAVKPSRTFTIASNSISGKKTANMKGSSFILYNTARISAIFERFDEEHSKGDYPSLPEIEKVDFSLLDQEEEWELLYNFLLGYPEMVKNCAKLDSRDLEICPQYICSFLSRLCSKFSAYYRRVRILTEGRDHLLPRMMARLYLLRAIQIVAWNALKLLNIDPVSRM